MLGALISGFVAILIGATLIPTVADEIEAATTGNVTGSSATVLDLTTLFFALAIAMAGLAVAAQAMRVSGIV